MLGGGGVQMAHQHPEFWRMRRVPPVIAPPAHTAFVGDSRWLDVRTSNYIRCLRLLATSLVQPQQPPNRPPCPSPREMGVVPGGPPLLQLTGAPTSLPPGPGP